MEKPYIYKENQSLMEFVKNHYFAKYPEHTEEQFEKNYNKYLKVPTFKASENIHQVLTNYAKREDLPDVEDEFVNSENLVTPEVHWIMRTCTQYYITKAFEAMKVDLKDPNVEENALDKGTPGRIAKLWVGDNPEDTTELGSGRWNKEPFLSCFPNEGNDSIITKEVDIVACCSHHFLPFSTFDGGKAIISYKPRDYVLGISKLQRFCTWASRRFWLQEDLTAYIGETIKRIASTEDVYIRLEGLVHGCEKFRGSQSHNGTLTTEYKSGIFKNS